MKKLLLLLAICCSSLGFSIALQEHKIDSAALSILASKLGITKHNDLIAETQKQWLRKSNQERWEMKELSKDHRTFVLNWAEEQGLFSTWKPSCMTYDKALILGASTSRMKMRLDHLKDLWNDGIRFQEIVWLTGDRPLNSNLDDLYNRSKNESEAAHLLWEEANLPTEMKNVRVIFVAVPMKSGGARPNTEDTIVAWLKQKPEACKCLFVSDQPFCGYQFSVVKASLPYSFAFDLVGPGVDQNSHPAAAAITLDSIARWIYQESLLKPDEKS